MPLSERENYLRNVTMTDPEWMPCSVHISDASWDQLCAAKEDFRTYWWDGRGQEL